MPFDRFEVRVSIQKLLLGLILVIVPMSILGLYLTERSDEALDQSVGTHFKAIANLYGGEVSQFFSSRVAEAVILAAEPAVSDAVNSSVRAYAGPSDNSDAAKLAAASKMWSAPAGDAMVKAMAASSASQSLRRAAVDGHWLRITVNDAHGATVAATRPPTNFVHSPDDAWQAVYAQGRGAVSIGDILFDDTVKAYYVNIGVPVFDPANGRWIGELTAAADVSGLLDRFQQAQIANGAHAALVGGDGLVVSGPNVDAFSHLKSGDFAAIADELGTVEGRQIGFVTANVSSGRHIIGFADTGLKRLYGDPDWYVLVSQDEHAALLPVHQLEQFALLMVILALFMVTLLGVYYFLHRRQQFSDIEEVLPSHQPSEAL